MSFTMEAADTLLSELRKVGGKSSPPANPSFDDETLRRLAPLISTAWLFDVVPRAMGIIAPPTLHNSDGETVVFHRVRFPFARGITQAVLAERLDAMPALRREDARSWNWLGTAPATEDKQRSSGDLAWGVTMDDGTPVLGNLEFKGRTLILAVTSAERAQRGTAFVEQALGELVGSRLTEIETIGQAMAALAEGRARTGAIGAVRRRNPAGPRHA